MNQSGFSRLIEKSNKEFHLVYSFGYWCKPCRELMPDLMKTIESRTDIAFYPLIVENLESREVQKNADYLKQHFDYDGRIYSADLALGKKPYKRYQALVETLVPGHQEYGMSLMLVFDKSGKCLFASTYHMDKEEKLSEIQRILN